METQTNPTTDPTTDPTKLPTTTADFILYTTGMKGPTLTPVNGVKFTSAEVKALLDCKDFVLVKLRAEGRPVLYMAIDDSARVNGRAINNAATAIIRAHRPSHINVADVFGPVLIVETAHI